MIHTAGPRATTIDQALQEVDAHTAVTGTEHVPLADCLGRVLAADLTAPMPVPAHPSSAMDGFAFRHADLATWRYILPLDGRVAAGHPLGHPLRPGHAVRILTGGVLPPGADTVAIQEECVTTENVVVVPRDVPPGANVRETGYDVPEGAVVLRGGTRLRPQDLGSAASVGRAGLDVHRRVRVAVLATGDELRPAGAPLPDGCIYETNKHTVSAALRAAGATVCDLGIVGDRLDTLQRVLVEAAASCDLVVTTGGVSVGDEDHVRTAIGRIGSLRFRRLPLKPGRSIVLGEIGGTPVLGLPGNPVACMVGHWLIGRRLLLRLMGVTADTDLEVPRFAVPAGFDHPREPGRREFLRCRLEPGPDGVLRAVAYASASSGMHHSLSWSHGLVEILEEHGSVAAGDPVRFVPYPALG